MLDIIVKTGKEKTRIRCDEMSDTEHFAKIVRRKTMDRRQMKTREAIFDAFSALLSQKNYNKITVGEIIDLANIGRSTFYAHFETKDHLLQELCRTLFEHVFSDALDHELTHDFSLSNSNAHDLIAHTFYHLREDHQNILRILNCESSGTFLNFFKEDFTQHFSPLLSQLFLEKTIAVPKDFLMEHVNATFIHTVLWWIREDLKTSPETLADYYLKVLGIA